MNAKDLNEILKNIEYPQDIKHLSIEDLKDLASEIRQYIISVISKTGGHLGAGLGVVELTIALHYIFNTPHDYIVWDVGHQTYPHKLLTGRKGQFNTLRKLGGISGFPKRSESEYDTFGVGHSSTSISAALGMAVARDIKAEDRHIIAVIGDGAMSAGLAYEGMNNLGHMKQRMIVILNDNEMSIAPAVGAMSGYLCKLMSSKQFVTIRNAAKHFFHKMPGKVENFAKKTKKYIKDCASGGNFFEEMGFHYIGPIDGHDLDHLIPILNNIKNSVGIDSPILLHVKTEKGRGFDSPETSKECFHAVNKFDLETKIQTPSGSTNLSYTEIFARTLIEIATQDESVVAITAAMPSGTGLDKVALKLPARVYDVGIAEQHAVTFAAGLAAEGIKPFVAIYSTFLQRAYDQVIHDVAIQSLPVRLIIDRAGLVGPDGYTHAGSFDIMFLSNVPNIIVMVPSSGLELQKMLWLAHNINDKPSAIRFPRGASDISSIPDNQPEILEIGKAKIVQLRSAGIAILALGCRLQEVLIASKNLQAQGVEITIIDARFAKPLDTDLILDIATSHKAIITIEAGSSGGFGALVSQTLANAKAFDNGLKFRIMCLPDLFIDHGTQEEMYKIAELDAKAIENMVLSLI